MVEDKRNKEARQAAWSAGKTRYFTGIACKHGHVADRFVSSGGCVQCVSPFKQKRNAFTKDAVPYVPARVWRRVDYTLEELAELDLYLQQCVDVFDRSKRPHQPPVMHSAPPQSVGYTTAPPGAHTLPAIESLPSADYPSRRPEQCAHGVDAGFCNICDP